MYCRWLCNRVSLLKLSYAPSSPLPLPPSPLPLLPYPLCMHWPRGACAAGSEKVSANQEIHNYYEEVSTHIKYKLNEFKGLTAAWQQTQNASKAVDEARADLLHAHEEVSSKLTLSRDRLQQSSCVVFSGCFRILLQSYLRLKSSANGHPGFLGCHSDDLLMSREIWQPFRASMIQGVATL